MAGAGHQLHQDFLALAIEFGRYNAEARGVAVRTRERRNKLAPDEIVGVGEDWYGPGRALPGANDHSADANDCVGCPLRHLGCGGIESVGVHLELAIDQEIGAFDEAVLAQLVEEGI
jgi:hypothetical protein